MIKIIQALNEKGTSHIFHFPIARNSLFFNNFSDEDLKLFISTSISEIVVYTSFCPPNFYI
jgi:hypothetical protein